MLFCNIKSGLIILKAHLLSSCNVPYLLALIMSHETGVEVLSVRLTRTVSSYCTVELTTFCGTLCALVTCTSLISISPRCDSSQTSRKHTHLSTLYPHTYPSTPHNQSVTSYRLSVGSWATLGQIVPLISESILLGRVLSGWMTSIVLGMRVLWHRVLLTDGQSITVHMWRTQVLYVQVGGPA